MAWHPFRNLGLKFAALALAALLWFTISGQRVERSVSVPILYRNLPEGMLITGDRFHEVSVHLRGGYTQLAEMSRDTVNVVVDLADAKPGQRVVTLRTDQVRAPFGVEVTQIDPASITVVIERASTAALLVEPRVEGQPAAGFVRTTTVVEPPTVAIAGPVSRLALMRSVGTEPISIEGARSSVTRTVNITLADPELRLTGTRSVRVTVTIEPAGGGGGGR
jgi:YbbR domain-containing protein